MQRVGATNGERPERRPEPGAPLAVVEQLQRELISAQRHALFGAMATSLVHEYNNLLQPVLLRAEDALARDDQPAMRRALEVAVNQSRKALLASRRLLNAGWTSDADGACQVADVVRDALQLAGARPFEKDDITVESAVCDALTLRGSAALVEQVLVNLLTSARAAIGRGGGYIRLRARREGPDVVIEVSDSAAQPDADRARTVINPFLASDPRVTPCDYAGVGMELNACRTILRLSGASMTLMCHEGAGRTYIIRWPAA